ncbi:MAG: outer membrane protein assembly factor BamD [Flavipsychrobacter sp.]|nr:outer membrane protein assembly factor BamD [Flavipsychrobacter sp.]
MWLLSSCSGYERLLKSSDVNKKLAKANEFYDKKQYLKASQLYESLMPVVKHTKNYEALYFRYAYSAYYMEDYMSASYHFRNFTEIFPNSTDLAEAEYMHGYSLYKFSPGYSLDPTYTSKAIGALQTFISNHPNSKYVKDANKYMDELRGKLERKDADAAKLYLNIGQYKAAGVAYASVMENYPESDKVDEYQYYIAKSLYLYARESVKSKQEERYINAMNAYNTLKEEYPNSPYVKEGVKYYQLAEDNLKKLRNEHK